MSKKSNLTTIRKNFKFLNFNNLDNKIFIIGLNFLKSFTQLLLKKNIILIDDYTNISCNKLFIKGQLYFKCIKIKKLNKKKFFVKTKKSFLLSENKEKIFKLFNSLTEFFKINCIILNFSILNEQIDKFVVKTLYSSLKVFLNRLFNRRTGLFVDFIKIISLYCKNEVNIHTVLQIISQIFCSIQKRSHSQFFIFIEKVFNLITSLIKKKVDNFKGITGVKFVVNGRIKGKPRSSSFKTIKGKVPTQSINKNIEYIKKNNYTPHYGVFGFKMWVLR